MYLKPEQIVRIILCMTLLVGASQAVNAGPATQTGELSAVDSETKACINQGYVLDTPLMERCLKITTERRTEKQNNQSGISFAANPIPAGYIPAKPIENTNRFEIGDYPVEAWRAWQQGITRTTFLIGEDGHPSNCQIEVSSGFELLDKAACDVIVARFRFVPATVNGVRVVERKRQPVRWKINQPQTSASNTNSEKGLQQPYSTSVGPMGAVEQAQATCVQLGFVRESQGFANCALQLYQSAQQAAADRARYQLDLQQFEATRARIAAADKEQARRERRAKWEALQRFGAGMAQSQSSTFAGAVADGNAAMLGLPPARSNQPVVAAPTPSQPRRVRIVTPDGRIVTCTQSLSTVNCF